jgi:hypothetical protein
MLTSRPVVPAAPHAWNRNGGRTTTKLIRSLVRGLQAPGRRLFLLGCSCAAVLGCARESAAQAGEACAEGRISSIFVDNHSVFDLSDPELDTSLTWAYRTANRLHARTDSGVIQRELLFSEGECYEVERLRDSERLLRALPFIANVDIFGVRQPDGTIHVIVDTQDEWSTRIEPRISESGVSGLRVREENLFGRGQQLSVFYLDRDEERVYGLSLSTPQLLGTRVDGSLEAGRTRVGYLLSESIQYPFVGEVGRWAMAQSIRRREEYFEYHIPGPDGLIAAWYPERRQELELGAAVRWGRRGYNRTLLGVALTGEWIAYPSEPRFGDDDRVATGAVPPPLRKDSVSSVRAVLMTGQRNVFYVRRRALDTVDGTEDVKLGVEADISIGPSIPGVSPDRDLAAELGLFAAGELSMGAIAGMTMVVEARRRYDSPATEPEWTDVFGRADGWVYWRPHPDSRHTLVVALAAAGGWHDRLPFQLTLGSRTGLRGYPDHAYAGGRRVVGTVEQRTRLGWPLPDLFDLAGVAFVDVGRMWAGDASFGESSPVRSGVGLGLRAAFPPGSRQTLRVDFGVPVGKDVGFGDVVISIGMGQLVGRSAAGREGQLERSARLGPSALFTMPEPQ